MAWRILSRRVGHSRTAQQGFTLIEVMVAMSISVVALLANLYLINIAHSDLRSARSLTNATNLATSKIAEFRTRVMDAPPCFSAATTTAAPGLVNYGFTGNSSPCTTGDINPDYPGLLNESFCSPPSSQNPGYPLTAAAGPSGIPLCQAPGVKNSRFCDPVANPAGCTVVGRTEPPASDQRQMETTTVDGILFTVAWDVSSVDLDPANPPAADLVGDLVKIKVEVFWMSSDKRHQVTMTTFVTGRAP